MHGARYSVYTRIARLALEEKGLFYRLNEIDIFGRDRASGEHALRHPFRRIPALSVDGSTLYETGAIARFIDEGFDGPPLQPQDPLERARMNQIVGIMDAYAFRGMVWDVFVERVRKPARGERPDEERIAAGLDTGRKVLAALASLKAEGPWLRGEAPTLADFWVAPMLILFSKAAEGRAELERVTSIRDWLERFNDRPSARATRFEIEELT